MKMCTGRKKREEQNSKETKKKIKTGNGRREDFESSHVFSSSCFLFPASASSSCSKSAASGELAGQTENLRKTSSSPPHPSSGLVSGCSHVFRHLVVALCLLRQRGEVDLPATLRRSYAAINTPTLHSSLVLTDHAIHLRHVYDGVEGTGRTCAAAAESFPSLAESQSGPVLLDCPHAPSMAIATLPSTPTLLGCPNDASRTSDPNPPSLSPLPRPSALPPMLCFEVPTLCEMLSLASETVKACQAEQMQMLRLDLRRFPALCYFKSLRRLRWPCGVSGVFH